MNLAHLICYESQGKKVKQHGLLGGALALEAQSQDYSVILDTFYMTSGKFLGILGFLFYEIGLPLLLQDSLTRTKLDNT